MFWQPSFVFSYSSSGGFCVWYQVSSQLVHNTVNDNNNSRLNTDHHHYYYRHHPNDYYQHPYHSHRFFNTNTNYSNNFIITNNNPIINADDALSSSSAESSSSPNGRDQSVNEVDVDEEEEDEEISGEEEVGEKKGNNNGTNKNTKVQDYIKTSWWYDSQRVSLICQVQKKTSRQSQEILVNLSSISRGMKMNEWMNVKIYSSHPSSCLSGRDVMCTKL